MAGLVLPGGLTLTGSSVDDGVAFSGAAPASGLVLPGGGELLGRAVSSTASGGSPMASAVLWYPAYDVPVDWEPADGLPNEGAGGSSMDATLATVQQADGGSAGVVGAAAIAVVDHANGRGVRANYTSDDTTRDSFVIPVNAAIGIDADESGMWTVDFTSLIDSTSGALGSTKLLDLYEGPNIVTGDDGGTAPAIGMVIEWADNVGGGAGSGGFLAAFNDDTLPFGAAVANFQRPASGTRHQLSMRFDRTAGTYQHWWDGAQLGSSIDIDDLSAFGGSGALGSLYSATADLTLGNRVIFHNVCFHRDGTDGFEDVAALHAALEATG